MGMYVSPASWRFAGGIEPDMPIGLPHHAHQLALALDLTAANTRPLGYVLCHFKLYVFFADVEDVFAAASLTLLLGNDHTMLFVKH